MLLAPRSRKLPVRGHGAGTGVRTLTAVDHLDGLRLTGNETGEPPEDPRSCPVARAPARHGPPGKASTAPHDEVEVAAHDHGY